MEALHKAYSTKGVSFYYVLSREPHPGFYGFVQPDSLEWRQEYVRLANAEMQSELAWIIDDMENTMQQTYGRMPNSEFIIDSDGTLLASKEWADPDELKKYLEEKIGPSGITDEDWKKLSKRDVVRTSYSDNDEVPGTELPRESLFPLQVELVGDESGDKSLIKLEAGMLAAGITPGGLSRLYLTVKPDEIQKTFFDIEEPFTILLTDNKGIDLKKEKLIAGKRRTTPDIYPHSLGVMWAQEENAKEMEFFATVEGKMGTGESELRLVSTKFRVYGKFPELGVIMDEILPDELPAKEQITALKSSFSGEIAMPMSFKTLVQQDPSDSNQGTIYFVLEPDGGFKWNNLASPQEVFLKSTSSITLKKDKLIAGQRAEPQDTNSRILAVNFVKNSKEDGINFEVEVIAWICSDAEGWCRRFGGTYKVTSSGK